MAETIEHFPNNNEGLSERKIARRINELPALKEGYVRLVHISNPEVIDNILHKGLSYENEGMITATARVYGKAEDAEYFSDDPRFASEELKAIVIDIPAEEYKIHNDITKSPGVLPPEYIVGVVDANQE